MKTKLQRAARDTLLAAVWLGARRLVWTVLLAAALFTLSHPAGAHDVQAFLSEIAKQAAESEKASRTVVTGSDGCLFFVPELRALSVGRFWGQDASRISRASKAEYADPLPAIVDFHQQLKKVGIDLLVVPVPAKAAVYPESVSSTIKAAGGKVPPRLDEYHSQFYRLLGEQGVAVVDLLPLYVAHRAEGGALYCKTDSHWSGRGVAEAAQAIADAVKDRGWVKELRKQSLTSEVRDVAMTGDLARMLDEQDPKGETLALTFVGTPPELTPVAPDRDSPVLLMGDSHTLIFHDPELVARGAGLPDHLALRFGVAVDLIGVRGSGATTTRIELLRRKDNLKGKKLVVWCFSFREFTESTTGWRKVPVIRE
jgi:alginate O-acetyltransferase complex protein AlgJ